MSDEILAVNEGFYRAFETLDPARMEPVWLASPDVVCIHPGWKACVGIESVMESWRAIFRGARYFKFKVADPRPARFGDTAMVTCLEVISSGDPSAPDFASMQAVNAYRRVEGEWKMILHHASNYQPVM